MDKRSSVARGAPNLNLVELPGQQTLHSQVLLEVFFPESLQRSTTAARRISREANAPMMVGWLSGHFSSASKMYEEQFDAMAKTYSKFKFKHSLYTKFQSRTH